MLDLSPTKLIIIFVVVVVLLGPNRLPEVARQLGAGWRKLRDLHSQIDRELRQSVPDLPSSQDIVRFARSPITLLNQLADFTTGPPSREGTDGSLHPEGTDGARELAGAPELGTGLDGTGERDGTPDLDGTGELNGTRELDGARELPALGPVPRPASTRPASPRRAPPRLSAVRPSLAALDVDDPNLN